MTTLVLACLLIALVAVGSLVLVAVGERGLFADRMPALAARAESVAAHLEGTVEPPQRFVQAVTDPRGTLRDGLAALRGGASHAQEFVGGNVRQLKERAAR